MGFSERIYPTPLCGEVRPFGFKKPFKVLEFEALRANRGRLRARREGADGMLECASHAIS